MNEREVKEGGKGEGEGRGGRKGETCEGKKGRGGR